MKTTKIGILILSLALAAPLFSCKPQNKLSTPDNTLTQAPAQWLGDTPHFVMMGKLGDYTYDIQLMDLAREVEGEVPSFGFKREYEQRTSDSAIRFPQIETSLKIKLGGIERAIDLELNNADFGGAGVELLNPFALIEGENTYEDGVTTIEVQGQKACIGFGIEWETATGDYDSEFLTTSGFSLFSLLEGTANGQAIVESDADDKIGGYISAYTAAGDFVVVSFTANRISDDSEVTDGVELSLVDNFYE